MRGGWETGLGVVRIPRVCMLEGWSDRSWEESVIVSRPVNTSDLQKEDMGIFWGNFKFSHLLNYLIWEILIFPWRKITNFPYGESLI